MQFGYGLNYLIDIAHAIIVDVEPTPARTYDEVASTKTMLDRTEQRFGLKPKRLAAEPLMVRPSSWTGWLAAASSRIFRSATAATAKMARIAQDFRWDRRRSFTFARTVRCCTPPAKCTRATNFAIALPSSTAKSARSRCSAVPKRRHERFPAMFMNMPATLPAG